MRLFLDTEFTGLPDKDGYFTPALISIGLVSDNGMYSFYAELAEGEDWTVDDCQPFVIDHVLPNLTGPAMTREALRQALRDWFLALPGNLIIAVDYKLDHSFLLEAVGEPRPENIPPHPWMVNSICDSFVYDVVVENFHTDDKPRHHALNDAEALRRAYAAWQKQNAE